MTPAAAPPTCRPRPSRSRSEQDHTAELRRLFDRGRVAWPAVLLHYERFACRATTATLDTGDREIEVHAPDLYLAFACAEGERNALRLFDAQYLSHVEGYVRRFNLPAHLVDEVRQRLRMKQLLGESPGISRYRARGPLGAWVRVAAVRMAMDVASDAGAVARNEVDGDMLDLLIASGDAPDLGAIKKAYRDVFMAALEESIRELSARDRTLLRLAVVDGVGIDALARIYGVHRATAARWLVAIRSELFNQIRQRLGLRMGASSSEIRSVARLLLSEIHLSAERILTGQG